MSEKQPFNPIEIPNIALSLALEVLDQPAGPFPPSAPDMGAGVYLLYYVGALKEYAGFRAANTPDSPRLPIYIGKADRKGKRKGITFAPAHGNELRTRLRNHARSIAKCKNLASSDFVCRYLSIEDAFIGLAEAVLVSVFDPLWNRVLDGFGNNPTGGPRSSQAVSKWDQFHPGRRRGEGPSAKTPASIREEVEAYFKRDPAASELRLGQIRDRIHRYGLG
jgi:hypothetical protein